MGTGLRLAELLALRIKDIDLDARLVTVRGGKGDKDRVTCLPASLRLEMETHLMRVRALYDQDRARSAAPVMLPDGLERKMPHAGREWPWFWLWPAPSESIDPRSGILRRHHLHEDTLGKALKAAFRSSALESSGHLQQSTAESFNGGAAQLSGQLDALETFGGDVELFSTIANVVKVPKQSHHLSAEGLHPGDATGEGKGVIERSTDLSKLGDGLLLECIELGPRCCEARGELTVVKSEFYLCHSGWPACQS